MLGTAQEQLPVDRQRRSYPKALAGVAIDLVGNGIELVTEGLQHVGRAGGFGVDALARSQAGPLPRTPQPLEGVTYAHKIEKAEAPLDWRLPASD